MIESGAGMAIKWKKLQTHKISHTLWYILTLTSFIWISSEMKQKEETNDLMLYKKHFKAEHFFTK